MARMWNNRKILDSVSRRTYWFHILGKFGVSGIEGNHTLKHSYPTSVCSREVLLILCEYESPGALLKWRF